MIDCLGFENTIPAMTQEISNREPIIQSISIQAAASRVWEAITDPGLMNQWMFETPIDIITTWEPGTPMIMQADWYKTGFTNTGTVLACEKERLLSYSHLSSLSRLPDSIENYTILTFQLTPIGNDTLLELRLNNFPTEAIYRHFAYYWRVAIVLLKKFVEGTNIQ